MGGWRVKRNDFAKVARNLPRHLDREVDQSGDRLVPQIRSVVRVDTGATLRTTKNYTPGTLHTTVGVGIHHGRGFYIRFYEFGTSAPNAYGNVIRADHRVYLTAMFFAPELADRMAIAVRRAL